LLSSIESYGISGTAFDDQLTGSALADQIGGNNGNDTLFGGAGRDAINGESGNDWLTGGEGSDSLDGGAGQDVAFFELSITGVEVNLATGVVADDGFGNAETILNVENVHGGLYDDVITLGSGGGYVFGRAGDDLLTGTDGFNKFFGGAGDDTVNGGSGIDELSLIDDLYYEPGPQTQGAVADLATGVVIDGWGGTDRVSGVENLEGTARGDLLQGASAGNRLLGLDGNDTLAGRGGADWLEGGAGNDILYGFLENSGEDPSAQDGADTLIGGDGKDLIRGNSGNDSIAGGAGDDNLRGDAGDDTIDGGEGLDIVVYRFDELGLTAGVVFSGAAIGTAAQLSFADGRGGTDLLIGIERVSLTGTRFADTLTGGSGDDVFRGGRGADLINGGSGTQDWILYDDATAAVTVNLGTGRAFGVEGNDTLSGIEWVTGSAYGDTLTGDGVANSLGGLAGNDRLEGGGGNDSLSGAVGSDTLTGGIGNDFLYGQEGTDWLEGGGGNDFLYGGQGSDTLTGQTGADGFVFDTAQDALNNVDLITDFAVGQDKIWLERGAFGAAGPDGTLAGAAFALGTVATEADDRLIYDNATGNLYYDYDGSGSDSGAVLFATVTAGTALTAASISVFSY
jgi:Ca2+-binding RTX toxin-like protein